MAGTAAIPPLSALTFASGQQIGAGHEGSVVTAGKLGNIDVAVKRVKARPTQIPGTIDTPEYEDAFYRGLSGALEQCSNIVPCYYGMRDVGGNVKELVFERMHEDIESWLKHRRTEIPFTIANQRVRDIVFTQETLYIALSIANALAALHSVGVYHKDIKAANVAVTPPISGRRLTDMSLEGRLVKFIDLGMACIFPRTPPDDYACKHANQHTRGWSVYYNTTTGKSTLIPASTDSLARVELLTIAFVILMVFDGLLGDAAEAGLALEEFYPTIIYRSTSKSAFARYVGTNIKHYFDRFVEPHPRLKALFRVLNDCTDKNTNIGLDELLYALIMAYQELRNVK